MNGLTRFWTLGAEDADRRVAAILAPLPAEAADRYLETSAVVIAVDRMTQRLRDWWLASETGRATGTIARRLAEEPASSRARAIATVILTAVVTNLLLTLAQGPRPGWFWLVMPSMAALFAVLMLAGSRSSQPN